MVRPVPAPPFAQKVLPMYCSMGAPLGFVGSLEGSCRPSSPNQFPQRTGNTCPFLVILPWGLTRNTEFIAVPPIEKVTVAVDALSAGLPLSKAVACTVWLPEPSAVALKV